MDLSYQKDIPIDKFDLDNEVVKQPELFAKWVAQLPEAISIRDKLKFKIDVIYAELDYDVRSLKGEKEKLTEAAIRNQIIVHQDYINVQNEYFEAKKDAQTIEGAIRAFEQRKDMIEALIKLHLAGYYSDVKPKQSRELETDVRMTRLKNKRRGGDK